jgi:hypothetical protein
VMPHCSYRSLKSSIDEPVLGPSSIKWNHGRKMHETSNLKWNHGRRRETSQPVNLLGP